MLILLGLAGCAGNQVRSIDPADRAKIDQSGMRSAPPPPIAYWKMPGDTGRGDPIHPDQFEGVLVELVQAPDEVRLAFETIANAS